MMSPAARQVYMVNQILRNLAAQDENAAVAATAAHINTFWDPAMRRALLDADPATLGPAAVVVALLRSRVVPTSPEGATMFDGKSDAG